MLAQRILEKRSNTEFMRVYSRYECEGSILDVYLIKTFARQRPKAVVDYDTYRNLVSPSANDLNN